jgi:ankyrin repeat protein
MDHRTECAAILQEFGADLSPKDRHGETPLMWASKHGLQDIADFLKARRAN